MKPIELRQRAGECVHESRAIMDKAESEKRALTAEEEQKVDALHQESLDCLAKVERAEKQDKLERDLSQPASEALRDQDLTGEQRAKAEKRERAFTDYLRNGEKMGAESRATLQADNDIGGGFFVGTERFIDRLIKTADNVLAIRGLATVFPCAREESLGAPKLDGDLTAVEFGSGELTSAEEDTGLAVGKRELKPRDIKMKLIKMSRRLMQSPRLDVAGLISMRFAYAYANGTGEKFATGTGASEPLGLFTASDSGIGTSRDIVTGSATGLTADGLLNIVAGLKSIYLQNARWLITPAFLAKVRGLKDGNQQYLWQPGLQMGQPSALCGYPYTVDDNVPSTFTNGLYVGMFGDFSWYWIADATNISVQVLVEQYATTNQIGYLFRDMACDGAPMLSEAFVRAKCGT